MQRFGNSWPEVPEIANDRFEYNDSADPASGPLRLLAGPSEELGYAAEDIPF